MGKLFIGDVEPSSLGAIDKLYVGAELVWPSTPIPGWQNGDTLTNLTYGGSVGQAVVNISPAPNGTLTIQSVAPVTGGQDTLNGFEYFTPVATDATLNRFFRIRYDAAPIIPTAWQAIQPFYFPVPMQFFIDSANPAVNVLGQFEFSDDGIVLNSAVRFDISLNFVAATSGFITMNGARVESRSGSANNLGARLTWNADGTVTPSVTGGNMSVFGVRDWWFGTPLPPTLWFRWRNAGQNGGTITVTGNTGTQIPENNWRNFNTLTGFFANVSSSGSSAYNRWADLEVDFSTQGGGGAVASTSTFRLQVIKT